MKGRRARLMLVGCRETSRRIMLRFLRMDAGSTSMLAEKTELHFFFRHGELMLTLRSAADDCWIFSSYRYYLMRERAQHGHIRAWKVDGFTEEVRDLRLPVWRCSNLAHSAVIPSSHVKLTPMD